MTSKQEGAVLHGGDILRERAAERMDSMAQKAEQAAANVDFIQGLCQEFRKYNHIDARYYERYEVKRGLRNADGTGVLAGVTQIGNVRGYYLQDGERVPMDGQLIYRGIDVVDLIDGFMSEERFGFEETAYLLLFGALPTAEQLAHFQSILAAYRNLPRNFTEDMILKAPSRDVMNKLARSVLALYSYDPDPDNGSMTAQMVKSLQLIARCPVIVAHAFATKRHYFDGESLYLHRPQEGLSVAENFLYSVRHDNRYTDDEAKLLDLCLVLHMEHGGGNNSAFTCRVLSSSGTDIYSAIAAAVGSLKGPRHGGANKNSGLIYGMGHAVYTLSDPRAILLKKFARKVAAEKGMLGELELFEAVERLAPDAFLTETGQHKVMSANVDLYSGLVYKMMGIPPELYTPLFAIARMVGWCAHRMEEVFNAGNKIIRPAYKAVAPSRPFVPLAHRG